MRASLPDRKLKAAPSLWTFTRLMTPGMKRTTSDPKRVLDTQNFVAWSRMMTRMPTIEYSMVTPICRKSFRRVGFEDAP